MRSEYSKVQRLLHCADERARLEALAELFMAYRKRLRLIVELRLDQRLRRRVDPSDVLQETYLEAQRRLPAYLESRPMPLFMWLRQLAAQRLHYARDFHLKAKARSVRREVPLELNPGPEPSTLVMARVLVGPGSTPSSAARREERRKRVREALERLDPPDREILALRQFERLTNEEAAALLGLEKEAARKRHYRALQRLKDLFGELGCEFEEGRG